MSDKIPASQLQPGDVLLYHGTGFISDLIRLFDGSEYSHAALFNGQGVVEALGGGITARPLAESVAGARYVDIYRFVSRDGQHKLGEPGYPVQPILGTAAAYLKEAGRYAYEQIVLLAILAGTRRMPVISDVPFLRWLVRNILDNAAEAINRLLAAGKQPMICSELVYRCYAEAGAEYDLLIRGADTLAARARSLPPLAAAAGPAAASSQAHDAAAIQAELDTFLAKYARAKQSGALIAPGLSAVPRTKRSRRLAATAATGAAARAVADFVTPRDLRDSPDLFKAGTLQA